MKWLVKLNTNRYKSVPSVVFIKTNQSHRFTDSIYRIKKISESVAILWFYNSIVALFQISKLKNIMNKRSPAGEVQKINLNSIG